MKNKAITLVTMFIFLSFSSVIHAQTKDMEIGIRFSGLNYFDFVYKQAKKENTYKRFTLGFTNLMISGYSNSKPDIGFISAFSFGTEHRKNINSHLKFVRGFEPLFAVGYFRQNEANLPYAAVGLGYVLGFQYDFSNSFYMNIETTPRVMGQAMGTTNIQYQFFAGFNSSGATMSLVYKFKKEEAKK